MRELERYVMASGVVPTPADAVLAEHRHLVLDNSTLSADEAAVVILDWLATP